MNELFRFNSLIAIVLCVTGGCADGDRAPSRQVEARTLTGNDLYRPNISGAQRTKLESDLAQAQAVYSAIPSEENAIWLGRRLAYLGRYREAIDVFTINIQRFPSSHKLLRHRGHRYITVREFDKAIADLGRATELIKGVPDEVEPDGAPNAAGVPRSTSHSNIWYHLALAHYLQGDFTSAADAWRECMKFAANDDMKVATANWLYVSLRRAGKREEAAEVLEIVKPDMEILENKAYFELLQVYKKSEVEQTGKMILATGLVDLSKEGVSAIGDATVWYGLGNWQLMNGDTVGAQLIFEHVLRTPNWAPFGYIAAEAELAREGR
jgi:tetratricopeptide (TPR) repeat protein